MKAQFRTGPTSSSAVRVDRDGGAFGGGVIYGVSLVTRGEARGHQAYADDVFLGQVRDAVNSAPGGVPSAADHSTYVGDLLGRVRDARLSADGSQTLGDLHVYKVAAARELLFEIAETDPGAMGMSLKFTEAPDADPNQVRDPRNVKGYRHVRLATLDGIDLVVAPAANPNGLYRASVAVAAWHRPTANQSVAVAPKVEARARRLASAMRGEQADYESELAEQWELAGEDPVVFASVARAAVRLAPEYNKLAGDAIAALTAHARHAFSQSEKQTRLAARRAGKCW